MPAAAAAMFLGARHAERAVVPGPDGVRERGIETRPAGARFILGLGIEQRRAAAHAAVGADVVTIPVLAGEGGLCASFAADLVLFRRERDQPRLEILQPATTRPEHENTSLVGGNHLRYHLGPCKNWKVLSR